MRYFKIKGNRAVLYKQLVNLPQQSCLIHIIYLSIIILYVSLTTNSHHLNITRDHHHSMVHLPEDMVHHPPEHMGHIPDMVTVRYSHIQFLFTLHFVLVSFPFFLKQFCRQTTDLAKYVCSPCHICCKSISIVNLSYNT